MFRDRQREGAVKELPPQDCHIVQVAVGRNHALLLTDAGIIYSWGNKNGNEHGQLGRQAADADTMQKLTPITESLRDESGKLEVIVQISCGNEHCMALTDRGKLYSWGANKAGQLGLPGYCTSPGTLNMKMQKASSPTPVSIKDGDGPEKIVKSCNCGPEGSACVTSKGEIYVWGAVSYYMFGEGTTYDKGDDCTIPVKLRGAKSLQAPSSQFIPRNIAVMRNKVVCTIHRANLSDDMLSVIDMRKQRATSIASSIRLRRRASNMAGGDDGDGVELEDMKQLNLDLSRAREELVTRINGMNERLRVNNEELKRVTRELTICDQQDTALNDKAVEEEVKRSEVQGNKAQQVHSIDGRLKDIAQFKASNRRNKVLFLAQRDKLEQENWKLSQDLTAARQEKLQADARSKLLRALQKGDNGKQGESSVDDGFRIASSKREELSATNPETLAGVGSFAGFREVLEISEHALTDVSSALKEVSAAEESGDGAMLEEVLELNLKLRRELNMCIINKIGTIDEASGVMKELFDELRPKAKEDTVADAAVNALGAMTKMKLPFGK